MFEKRRTVKALRKLARDRAKASGARVQGNFGMVLRRAWLVLLRLLFSAGLAIIALLKMSFAPAGIAGLFILLLFWNRVFADAARPAAFFSLYPASAEQIWEARVGVFKRRSLWGFIDALAIFGLAAANHMVSLPEALASLPAALAYAACMTSLPLGLLLAFPSFNPGKLISLLVLPAVIFIVSAKELPPGVVAAIVNYAGVTSWFVPLGWLCHFMTVSIGPVERLIFGLAALAAGAVPIRLLADAVKRKLILREEEADAQDARISIAGGEVEEREDPSGRGAAQQFVEPAREATASLQEKDWGTFAGPAAFGDRIFWRTLSARQKLIARLAWPYGFRFNKGSKMAWRIAAIFLAFAAACRFLGMDSAAWSGIAFGALPLCMLVPLLTGYGFVFQGLYLNGRRAARCQFFPVSIPEICGVLHRYQIIRVATTGWVAVIFGALAWLIMGLPVLDGAVDGLILVALIYGFHPLVVIAKLSSIIRCVGRRMASIPCFLLLLVCGFFALACLILGIVFVIMMAFEPPKPHALLAIVPGVLGAALAMRLCGWLLLQLYLLFIQRSWLDAVTQMPRRPVSRGR